MMRLSALLLLLAVGFMGLSGASLAKDNLHFKGALIADPCTLKESDTEIEIDFLSISDKYLYRNGRTLGIPFTIHLEDCDTSLGNLLKLSISGAANTKLPGLLATSPDLGIGIGIETMQGIPIALNNTVYNQGLVDGNNTVDLRAYVQGEPDAIAQKNIKYGDINAIATILLEYE